MTPYVYGNKLNKTRLQADLATGQVPPLVALAVLAWLYGPVPEHMRPHDDDPATIPLFPTHPDTTR